MRNDSADGVFKLAAVGLLDTTNYRHGKTNVVVETRVFETQPSRDFKILETETFEKRVSRSLEPRLQFRGLHNWAKPQTAVESLQVAVGLATYPTISAMLQIFATLLSLQQQAGRASVHRST
jgi:hypothetical protein